MSAMKRTKVLAAATCTLFAISAVGDFSASPGNGFSFVSEASAGNGNGGGKGGGNGGGRGGGNAGGNGGGKSAAGASRGKSGNKVGLMSAITGKSRDSNRGGKSLFDGLFGNQQKGKDRSSARAVSKGKRSTQSGRPKDRLDLASPPVPNTKPVSKEKNFRAKLAGLNSLNRNYHAYMNAADPRMQAVRSYVMASAEYDIAAEDLEAALASLQDAETSFAESVASIFDGLTPYDNNFSYDDVDIAGLESRLTNLESLDPEALTAEESAAVQAEIDAINQALSTDEAASLQAATDEAKAIETSVQELAGQITDEALTEALLEAANDNRVAEYGVEDYVDDEMLDWAKDLLGVDESYGKIDQVREALESQPDDEPVVEEG